MSDPKILLLGPPGAGKGTQSQRIVETFDVAHVTTGDALRDNKDLETEHGTPREYMDAGELVPDPVVNEIVEAALDDAAGFVLDGYPRNLSQAEYLAEITELDIVLSLDVSTDELIRRLTGRRVCADCGRNYHIEFDQPAESGVCDDCEGELIQRDDDNEETVRERLRVFEENTQPVIEFYREKGVLIDIDGEGNPNEVWNEIKSVIDSHI